MPRSNNISVKFDSQREKALFLEHLKFAAYPVKYWNDFKAVSTKDPEFNMMLGLVEPSAQSAIFGTTQGYTAVSRHYVQGIKSLAKDFRTLHAALAEAPKGRHDPSRVYFSMTAAELKPLIASIDSRISWQAQLPKDDNETSTMMSKFFDLQTIDGVFNFVVKQLSPRFEAAWIEKTQRSGRHS